MGKADGVVQKLASSGCFTRCRLAVLYLPRAPGLPPEVRWLGWVCSNLLKIWARSPIGYFSLQSSRPCLFPPTAWTLPMRHDPLPGTNRYSRVRTMFRGTKGYSQYNNGVGQPWSLQAPQEHGYQHLHAFLQGPNFPKYLKSGPGTGLKIPWVQRPAILFSSEMPMGYNMVQPQNHLILPISTYLASCLPDCLLFDL